MNGRPMTLAEIMRAEGGFDEPRIERLRRLIEEAYFEHPTGCGGSFGELLCYEIHTGGLTFIRLARKWGVSLPTLGMLIADHCNRLEDDPAVRHSRRAPSPHDPAVKL
jgi:hypothetical protein